jgi:mannobiose 2-epimerase
MVSPRDEWLAADARRELLENILPFWRRRSVDRRRGGFIGQLSNDLQVQETAPKGLVLNARILWTFSAVHRLSRQVDDAALAQRAYRYLTEYFRDPDQGGYYWELDPTGRPLDDRKKIYGQAFCVYALTEYHRAFADEEALRQAIELFGLIEAQSRDAAHGGYLEALSREWQPLEDMRLSEQDLNEKKSMNNHLHILEAYTNLLRVWPEPVLADRLRELARLFRERILNADQTHLQHFFDESWAPRSDRYTFGHDIEASWLLCEAAHVLGDPSLQQETQALAVKMARVVLREGVDHDGGVVYEGHHGRIINSDREWWPQAEAVVGFHQAWELTGDVAFLEAAERCWQFIQDHIVDATYGEWFWRVSQSGEPDPAMPKISAWKCPYHNSRCCLELIRRAQTPSSPS